MNNVKIIAAKIKDQMFLEADYTEELPGHTKNEISQSCTVPVHEDLIKAFDELIPHLILISDQEKFIKNDAGKFPDFGTLYEIRGFIIRGADDNEKVMLTGVKKGAYGTVPLNSPFLKWKSEEYPFIADLGASIEKCIYEVDQYLFSKKRAPELQPELPFGDDGAAIEKFAEEEL